MLILALMIALSFSLSHALHEKMRLQQHSDALAYSMGIVEARAFNYFASSNRAIAASLVAMNSLHADMAAASVEPAMLGRAQTNFYWIAAEEFAQCPPYKFQHCVHGFQAIKVASKFGKAKRKYEKKVKNVDKTFEQTVRALDAMVDTIHASQDAVLLETGNALRTGSSAGLSKLKEVNAPDATALPGAIGLLNMAGLACAVDGSPVPCARQGAPDDTSLQVHGALMGSGTATCTCVSGFQDNDQNGTCSADCASTTCDTDRTCDDASGTAECFCSASSVAPFPLDGTASAGPGATSSDPNAAFDGNTGSQFNAITPDVNWLQYDYGANNDRTVAAYTLTSYGYSDTVVFSFQLEGSPDGSTWTVLDQETTTLSLSDQTKTFQVQNADAYRYYRLHFTTISGYVRLQELQLSGCP
jgi:hypothetical protein